MKRILLLAVLVLSLGLLGGCGNTDTSAKGDTQKKPSEEVSTQANADSSAEKKEDSEKKDSEEQQNAEASKSNESADAAVENASKSGLKEGNRAGNLAKDVEFELWEDGKVVKLSDYRGEPVVLNFWTSWCPYCVGEMPALNDAYNEYKDKSVKVIAINLAFQDDANAAKKAMENAGVEFIVANDNTGQAASAFGVRGIPASIFIDKDGVIYDNVAGAMDKDAFVSFIKGIVE